MYTTTFNLSHLCRNYENATVRGYVTTHRTETEDMDSDLQSQFVTCKMDIVHAEY